ncbi:MAG: hypothetical protein ZNDK_0526 [Candidatus Desulfovibrio kirbyi]|uniref:Uncharacterized protein n=1 Tax=Candidatus Desulfovibrio kirbyi TaxID=2696086 RepID=A0A6L2R5F6_9BACT|nr:MAG: hypothetical protein ZNDK_0526 [Candidatus Desulfovibrio kirbyi]
MPTEPIIESGMTFGPYPDGYCFHIENSTVYQDIRHDGVWMAEFLLLRDTEENQPVMWVVEAKSSSPHPQPRLNFDKFITEIYEKLLNAFYLTLASRLGRYADGQKDLPEPFKNLDLSQTGVRFVLVIHGHREEWLHDIKYALEQTLNPAIKIWACGSNAVVVLNDELARECGLIHADHR